MTGNRAFGRFLTVFDGFLDLSGLVILRSERCGHSFGMQRYLVGLMVHGMRESHQLSRHVENFKFLGRGFTLSHSYGAQV